MKGDKKIIDVLNDILTAELTAINQYFLHAKMCQNWGYERLYAKSHSSALDEMKHASVLIDRILYLEGVPNVQRLGRVGVGETVREQMKLDLALEADAVKRLNQAIALCTESGDSGSRELLESMLRSEEEHLGWIESQMGLMDQVGDAPYLAEQIRNDE
jgi:bacterioferritin